MRLRWIYILNNSQFRKGSQEETKIELEFIDDAYNYKKVSGKVMVVQKKHNRENTYTIHIDIVDFLNYESTHLYLHKDISWVFKHTFFRTHFSRDDIY